MSVLVPTSLADAVAALASRPGAVLLAGGTDLMVEVNFDRRRPERILDLTRVDGLEAWTRDGDDLVIGAGVTHSRLVGELPGRAPGLAIASSRHETQYSRLFRS